MHDFRVVGDGTEKTLIFDVVAEKKYYKKENINTIKTKICQDVKKINPKYRCIINVEQEFI
ncbi:MAG: cation transporter, partial [Clostridiaceae bacterium]